MLFSREGIALIEPVLMTAHTPQGRPPAVDAETLFRVTGEASHARSHRHFVVSLIPPLESGCHGIKAGIINIPPLRIRHIDGYLCGIRRTYRRGCLISVLIPDRIHYREILIRVFHPGNHLESSSAALARLRRHLQPGTSIVLQVKMCIRHTDQVHAPVQAAVKGKVSRLGIDAVLIFIAAGHYQKVFSLFPAQSGDIRPEDRIPSLMVGHLAAIDIDRSLLPCRQDLHKNPAAAQRLSGSLKASGVPASAPVILAVAVMPVHRVPGVGQIHSLPCQGQFVGQPHVLSHKSPILIQTNYFTHSIPPFSYPFTSARPVPVLSASALTDLPC